MQRIYEGVHARVVEFLALALAIAIAGAYEPAAFELAHAHRVAEGTARVGEHGCTE